MSDKKYWNSLEQLNNDPAFVKEAEKEFKDEIPVADFLGKESLVDTSSSRRDFLKFMGFSLGAATLAACETPVTKAIPYVVKPEEITPGVANWYASSFNMGGYFASILVKTREGRPIFIKANDAFPEGWRGVSAKANASVIELYDDNRFQGPVSSGEYTSWSSVDSEIGQKLAAIKAGGGNVRVLSSTISSPSTQAVLSKFEAAFKVEGNDSRILYTYDANNYEGITAANFKDFGKAVIPTYDFSKAKVIVSVGADFLGSWLDSTSNSKGYAAKRNPENAWMSRHFQFEAKMSTSGASADVRGAIKPSEYGEVLKMIYNALAKKAGVVTAASGSLASDDNDVVSKVETAANELWSNKGASIVISGSNDSNVQQIVNGINNLLTNYGSTISMSKTNNLYSSNAGITDLLDEMNSGKVDALIIYGANPSYSMPQELEFDGALAKVGLKINFADRPNETTEKCDYVCPDHFYLESWNDHQPYTGVYALTQPTINKLFNTRQAQESLLLWAGETIDYYSFMKMNWQTTVLAGAADQIMSDDAFNRALQSGVYLVQGTNEAPVYSGDVLSAARNVGSSNGNWEVEFYFSNAIGDGSQGNNPHLQELPDSVTKISWDNYLTMSPSDMIENGFETRTAQETPANLVNITINGVSFALPAVSSPGQKKGTVGVALGYGHTVSGKCGMTGVNVYPALSIKNGAVSFSSSDVSLEDSGSKYAIASVQTHHTMMGRKIVNETTFDAFKNYDKADEKNGWNKPTVLVDGFGRNKHVSDMNLWDDHGLDKGHHWGMSVDLNACNGCGACVTACHIENNVPVVGKDEIRRTRSMFWLRVDRYYSSDMSKSVAAESGTGVMDMYAEMEVPSDYPDVVFQPVMCQHCNHAPCETVCPVAATTHSEEGLNQMTYNRCVGTRYCANNCPYKVRRFNWFNYNRDPKFTDINPAQSDLARMVLNPDVVVRSRGVIEKCSFCVQKIQEGKLSAKKAGRPVKDGEVTSACAEACAVGAIVFGDLNDSKSKVRDNFDNDRAYFMIEEVGTQPNVSYMTKVRNRKA